MILERIIFNLLAFSLFINIFFKMVKRNDTVYVYCLIIQSIGIAIGFLEILINKYFGSFTRIFEYLVSIIIPTIIIIMEARNINISEKLRSIKAKVYFSANNIEKAKEEIMDLLTKYPESYLGHKLLAEIYEKTDEKEKAIDEYIKTININDKDYQLYYKIAILMNSLNKKEEATSMLESVLKKKPDYQEASIALGDILLDLDKSKEAIDVYTSALRYNPNSFDLYYGLGMAYTLLNDFKNAQICYEKAAILNDLAYNVYYNLGQIALIYTDIDEAEKYFMQSIKGEEIEADSYFQLARISMMKRDKQQAINYANLAVELDISMKKKIEKDPLFIPIQSQLIFNKTMSSNSSEGGTNKKKKLSAKELKVKKHLEKTFTVVDKLSIRNMYGNKREFNRNDKDRNREREE